MNAINESGETALHFACVDGNLDIVRYLVEQGCVDTQTNKEGDVALLEASRNGRWDIVVYLALRGCVDVNVQDKEGRTALLLAIQHAGQDVVLDLVKNAKPM